MDTNNIEIILQRDARLDSYEVTIPPSPLSRRDSIEFHFQSQCWCDTDIDILLQYCVSLEIETVCYDMVSDPYLIVGCTNSRNVSTQCSSTSQLSCYGHTPGLIELRWPA